MNHVIKHYSTIKPKNATENNWHIYRMDEWEKNDIKKVALSLEIQTKKKKESYDMVSFLLTYVSKKEIKPNLWL